MEKRLLLALLLSAIVFVIYEWLYPPRPTLAHAGGTPPAAAAIAPGVPSSATPTPTISPAAPTVTGPAAESLDVKTTDAVFRFTNVGAAPVSVTMLDYNSTRVRSE